MSEESTHSQPVAWHYTTGRNFIAIVETGCIMPSTAGVPHGERPAVWFSLNQSWEATANKGWTGADGARRTLTKEETFEKGGGLVRFGVSLTTAPYGWPAFKKRSGVRPLDAIRLAQTARSVGADPNDWRVSFEPVARDQWVAVEVWDRATDRWVNVLPDEDETVSGSSSERKELAEQLADPSPRLARKAWKPGRNEPCSCGSGRKFKKCCIASSTQSSIP